MLYLFIALFVMALVAVIYLGLYIAVLQAENEQLVKETGQQQALLQKLQGIYYAEDISSAALQQRPQ